MVLQILVPEQNAHEGTTRDLVFSILADDKPKTLTQLHREIKRKHGVSVTFQAVIKAVRSLLASNVLVRKEKLYSLNEEWVFETRNFFDHLYKKHFKVKRPMEKTDAGENVTVYVVKNLLELDRMWNDLLTNWAKKEEGKKINAWMGRHCWWLIPRLEEEDILHDFFLEKGVRTYNVVTGNTVLDKSAVSYYRGIHESIKMVKKKSETDSHIAAFGKTVLKFDIPQKLSEKLERIYGGTKRIEDLDLKRTLDVFKENFDIEVILIRDEALAERVRNEIMSYHK